MGKLGDINNNNQANKDTYAYAHIFMKFVHHIQIKALK